MYKIYGIKNCNTMKRALDWLNAHEIHYIFHNYKIDGLSPQQLKQLMDLIDWKLLLNTKGLTYRKLDTETKMKITNVEEAEKIMLTYPSIIKRPILIKNSYTLVGFSPEQYAFFTTETVNGR